MTELHLFRGNEFRKVLVPRCPMFDFDHENDTEEVRELLAQGFHISGHVDGRTR